MEGWAVGINLEDESGKSYGWNAIEDLTPDEARELWIELSDLLDSKRKEF